MQCVLCENFYKLNSNKEVSINLNMDWITIAAVVLIIGLLGGVHGLLQKIQKTLQEVLDELKSK